MDKPKLQNYQRGPEEPIVQAIIKYLTDRGWTIRRTHGNEYQSGFPDLWAGHPEFGHRWIEVKNPYRFSFTKAQLDFFPVLTKCGDGVWILIGGYEAEYKKLFQKPNWHAYVFFANNMGCVPGYAVRPK